MAYLRELNYPVYEIEREHLFPDLGRQLDSLKQMTYPVREGVEFSHQFNEVQKKVVSLRNLTGPFFDIESRSHGFILPNQNVTDLKDLKYPVTINNFLEFTQKKSIEFGK